MTDAIETERLVPEDLLRAIEMALPDTFYGTRGKPYGIGSLRHVLALATPVDAEVAEAARMFANAADRLDYYDGEYFDGPLYAMEDADSSLRELLNGEHGRRLMVSDLRKLRAALGRQSGARHEL